jgi:hypothetical protein
MIELNTNQYGILPSTKIVVTDIKLAKDIITKHPYQELCINF